MGSHGTAETYYRIGRVEQRWDYENILSKYRFTSSHGQYYAYTVWGVFGRDSDQMKLLYVEQTSVVGDGRRFANAH